MEFCNWLLILLCVVPGSSRTVSDRESLQSIINGVVKRPLLCDYRFDNNREGAS